MLPFELTKDTPYLALSGELWSVFYEYFNKYWLCYKGFLLYLFRSMLIDPPIPGIQLFQNLTSKIQGQGDGWGQKLKSHNMGPTFSRLTSLSFNVNRASHSWVMTFPKFDLENQGSRSWVRSQFKVTMWVKHPIDSHAFCSISISPPIPETQHFHNLTLKIKGQVMGEVTVQSHNVGLTSYRLTSLSWRQYPSSPERWGVKRYDRRRTDWTIHRATWSQLKRYQWNGSQASGVLIPFYFISTYRQNQIKSY